MKPPRGERIPGPHALIQGGKDEEVYAVTKPGDKELDYLFSFGDDPEFLEEGEHGLAELRALMLRRAAHMAIQADALAGHEPVAETVNPRSAPPCLDKAKVAASNMEPELATTPGRHAGVRWPRGKQSQGKARRTPSDSAERSGSSQSRPRVASSMPRDHVLAPSNTSSGSSTRANWVPGQKRVWGAVLMVAVVAAGLFIAICSGAVMKNESQVLAGPTNYAPRATSVPLLTASPPEDSSQLSVRSTYAFGVEGFSQASAEVTPNLRIRILSDAGSHVDPGWDVWVVGSTDSDEGGWNPDYQLSLARAQSVREVLVEGGVASERVTIWTDESLRSTELSQSAVRELERAVDRRGDEVGVFVLDSGPRSCGALSVSVRC